MIVLCAMLQTEKGSVFSDLALVTGESQIISHF